MFDFFKSKGAVIVDTNIATGEVEVSTTIPTITQANHVSRATIFAQGGLIVDREENEFGGDETSFIVRTEQRGVWNEHQHIVLPEDLPA